MLETPKDLTIWLFFPFTLILYYSLSPLCESILNGQHTNLAGTTTKVQQSVNTLSSILPIRHNGQSAGNLNKFYV